MSTSHHRLHKCTRMQLELKYGLTTFQQAKDVIFVSLACRPALVYLDEIVQVLKSPNDHIEQIRCILHLLDKAGLTFKVKKCKIFARTTDYLVHAIWPVPLEVAEHTMDVAWKLKDRRTKT